MNLIVYNWVKEFLKGLFWQVSERLLRVLLFCLPLGAYLTLLQFRSKASKVSSLSAFTNENSVWQHIFPGFMLVAIDPVFFKNSLKMKKDNFQNWIRENRYLLSFLFALIMVLVIVGKEIFK